MKKAARAVFAALLILGLLAGTAMAAPGDHGRPCSHPGQGVPGFCVVG
jgi:hypothetical protein